MHREGQTTVHARLEGRVQRGGVEEVRQLALRRADDATSCMFEGSTDDSMLSRRHPVSSAPQVKGGRTKSNAHTRERRSTERVLLLASPVNRVLVPVDFRPNHGDPVACLRITDARACVLCCPRPRARARACRSRTARIGGSCRSRRSR